jgi:hypothetical protein
MKKLNYVAIFAMVIIVGSLGSGLAWSEVRYIQINESNLLVRVSNNDWQPSTGIYDDGLGIPATWVDQAEITLDGKATEANWDKASEITVPLAYGDISMAFVQALYTDDDVYIKVRWKDNTEDRQHHPWVWDEGNLEFVAGPQVEDSLMLSFEAHCEWTPSFLSGYGYDFDGWHWLAARSDPLGQAVDIEGNVKAGSVHPPGYTKYTSRNIEDTWNVKFLEDGEDVVNVNYTESEGGMLHAEWNKLSRVYLLQPADETATTLYRDWPDGNIRKPVTQFVETIEAPEATPDNQSRMHPQFIPLRLEGDAGEVKAKGHWENGYWTVEFQRALVTEIGGPDDTTFTRLTQFSIHVSDRVERVDQSSESKRLFLTFLKKESPLGGQHLLVNDGK